MIAGNTSGHSSSSEKFNIIGTLFFLIPQNIPSSVAFANFASVYLEEAGAFPITIFPFAPCQSTSGILFIQFWDILANVSYIAVSPWGHQDAITPPLIFADFTWGLLDKYPFVNISHKHALCPGFKPSLASGKALCELASYAKSIKFWCNSLHISIVFLFSILNLCLLTIF